MKSELTAKLAKKIIKNDKETPIKITKFGLACLKCLESEPAAVAHAIKNDVIQLMFKPEFIKTLNSDIEVFSVWKRIQKGISKHYFKSKSKMLEIILEKSFDQAKSILAEETNETNFLKLLIFSLLAIKKVKKRQILIDLSDLLFNTFKSAKLFEISCLAIKTLYLKLSLEDFDEVFQRVFPSFYPSLLKTISTAALNPDLLSCLKLIEFFKLIQYDKFYSFEGILIRILENRVTELNANSMNTCSVELVTLNSHYNDQDPENFYVLFLNANKENVLNSIEHLISICFQMPLKYRSYLKQIKKSIILDLIRG